MEIALGRHLLGLEGFSLEQIELILRTTRFMKQINSRAIKKVPTLRGRTVLLFFHENSTRTRTSFELAAKRLSADTVSISASGSSLVKGETLLDTAMNLQAMAPDAIVIRHSSSGAPHFLARHLDCTVINGGDGMHEHPTQALLDIYTIQEHFGGLQGLKVAIIGDIIHSRVARSNILGLNTMGAEVYIYGPPTMMPNPPQSLGARVAASMEEALREAHVIMMLRVQKERDHDMLFPSEREYARCFGLNRRRLQLARPDAVVMHPGPTNRGLEISPEVADGVQSLILAQVNNGVALRMALLYLLMGDGESRRE
ncbi:MAG: aspartate carbamoyltransferase catalytic subunit [Desulfarculales bacterium]|jgi:aspartate carbamoyltransferase catalytic subunit|nr:aspartate carbamoyltransferase catalytic subunit [Desulfarculales bacterium]